MAINNIEDMQITENIVFDATKDAVVIDGVSKIFKKSRPLVRLPWKVQKEVKREVHAVDNVTMTVKRREIVGILGANGSGKSTLIRMLSTLLIPDTGHVTIFGYDVVRDEGMVQRLINRVSVEASFFKKLSPMENLIYAARLYNMPGAEARATHGPSAETDGGAAGRGPAATGGGCYACRTRVQLRRRKEHDFPAVTRPLAH
jgi:ABC-2 type transport system ATP-binding protein